MSIDDVISELKDKFPDECGTLDILRSVFVSMGIITSCPYPEKQARVMRAQLDLILECKNLDEATPLLEGFSRVLDSFR